ncbi:MAG: 30S ribosome-binding factor RbfA [Oscillospiraceae bacterium]|nr:30S ribosome-binding factor RbfA [Oscillospiraceae bacterium]
MPSHRTQRASEDVRRELTDIFRTLKDPRITGVLSIVKLDLTTDYSYCTVNVSSLDGESAAREAVAGLTSAAGFIRREIGSRLRLRRTPEFIFMVDTGIEHSAEIHRILRGLSDDN